MSISTRRPTVEVSEMPAGGFRAEACMRAECQPIIRTAATRDEALFDLAEALLDELMECEGRPCPEY
jgi:hypothetical protein